jgi:hypothetical protein
VTLYLGDCLSVMKTMPDNSIDAFVEDPPSGIAFMNMHWDKDKGGRDRWIEWLTEIMQEQLRIAKPGAHMFCWALPRTSHWTTTAIEDAGWEIRDVVTHLFGSGFPKSMDVGKAIDKAAGAEREIIGPNPNWRRAQENYHWAGGDTPTHQIISQTVTAPATDAARQWDGWGTALKPAAEHWILARKPLSEPTVAANVLKWGCGALNIDAARIGSESLAYRSRGAKGLVDQHFAHGDRPYHAGLPNRQEPETVVNGRWPTNVVLSHVEGPDGCEEVGARKVKYAGGKPNTDEGHTHTYGWAKGGINKKGSIPADADGMETVSAWRCVPGCPVAELDRQSGVRRSGELRSTPRKGNDGWGMSSGTHEADTGTASRFFFVAKPSRAERERGLAAMARQRVNDGRDTPIDNPYQRGETERLNVHPTVKSTALMRHLLTLVVPPGGIVLDPFTGSGSTGVAAAELGMQFIGIEQHEPYYRIALARIEDAELRMEADRVLPLFAHAGIEL